MQNTTTFILCNAGPWGLFSYPSTKCLSMLKLFLQIQEQTHENWSDRKIYKQLTVLRFEVGLNPPHKE
jgi:hypothetical protein